MGSRRELETCAGYRRQHETEIWRFAHDLESPERSELAQSASQIELSHTLAKPDHDHPRKTGVNKTRRGRAPIARQVGPVAWRSGKARRKTRTLRTPCEFFGHGFAELYRPLRRTVDGIDQRAADATAFERVQPGDRRTAGTRHHVLEPSRVLPGFEQQLG